MTKVVLQDITTSYASASALQANFEALETALDNTLSRDGSTPNQMEADLDMNSKRILNLPNAVDNGEPITLGQLLDLTTVVVYEPNPHNHLWAQITDKPATFTPSAHTHPISDVVGLQGELNATNARVTTLESHPRIYTQATEPAGAAVGDLWAW